MTATERTSFKKRVLNAGAWTLAGYVLTQIIRFGSNLVMTRLLLPEMFGLMAVASMVMTCLGMFSDIGLPQSVVQSKRGDDPLFLNTVWVTQIVRGFLLWAIALALSGLLYVVGQAGWAPRGSVYADPRLPGIIAVLASLIIILSFQSTKLFEAGRNLSLGGVTANLVLSQVASVLGMFAWVFFDRSIWALVAGNLASMVVGAVLSHVTLPGHSNRWQWDRSAFHEIIHFGKWMFLSSILGFLALSGDRLLLAGLISPNQLGLYMIAFLIFSAIDQVMTKVFVDVSFPALSEVARERQERLKLTYYRFFVAAALFAYFCSGALIISGQTLIDLLYDNRYAQSGWMLQTLGLALLTIPFRVSGSCLLALGLPKIYSRLIALRAICLFVLCPAGFYLFGLPGAVWGIVISYFSSVPLTVWHLIKLRLFDLSKELLVAPAFIAGMAVAEGFNWMVALIR